MDSEEFKVTLVFVLGLAVLFSSGCALHNVYFNGYYAGQVSILQPKEAK